MFSQAGLKGDAFDRILNAGHDTQTREGKLNCDLVSEKICAMKAVVCLLFMLLELLCFVTFLRFASWAGLV